MRDQDIAQSLRVGAATVERVRRRCVEEGLERALGRKEQLNRRPKKLDGAGEAHLVALACSQPPSGRAGWTMHLLADQLVEREMVDRINPETVRRCLKKTGSSPRSATGQALAEGKLAHPAPGQCGVRLCHGGCAGGVAPQVPGQRGAGVPGRDQQATGAGDPQTTPAASWGCQGLRLRIPA